MRQLWFALPALLHFCMSATCMHTFCVHACKQISDVRMAPVCILAGIQHCSQSSQGERHPHLLSNNSHLWPM